MARQPRYRHIKIVRSRGRRYAYFNTGEKVDGKPVYTRLPDPADVGFWDSYAACMAWRTRRKATEYTVARMITDYLASDDYLRKKPATQQQYRIQLSKAGKLLGEFPVNELEHSDIQLVIDGEGWGAHSVNAFIAALGVVYRWGRARGKAKIRPVDDFKQLKGGEHQPWPENVLEAALKAENDTVRLAVHLLYFTGQRIGDVLRMTWNDIEHGRIKVRQQKTSKAVEVPLTAELRAELDRTPRAGITIMNRQASKKGIEQVRDILQAFAKDYGVKVVTHGLRKNAVNALLEAGCTIGEVAAITGQSFSVVEQYARKVDQRKMGDAAILKLEMARKSGK